MMKDPYGQIYYQVFQQTIFNNILVDNVLAMVVRVHVLSGRLTRQVRPPDRRFKIVAQESPTSAN
jgi:hypothetical protein